MYLIIIAMLQNNY